MPQFPTFGIGVVIKISPSQANTLESIAEQISDLGFSIKDDGIRTEEGNLQIVISPLPLDRPAERIEKVVELIGTFLIEYIEIGFFEFLNITAEQRTHIISHIEDNLDDLGLEVIAVTGREILFPDSLELLDYDISEEDLIPYEPETELDEPVTKFFIKKPDGIDTYLSMRKNGDDVFEFRGYVGISRLNQETIPENDILAATKLAIKMQKAARASEAQKSADRSLPDFQ